MKKPLLLVLALSLSVTSYSQLQFGTQAPDFTVTDFEGNTWHLQDILDSGLPVGLMFAKAENEYLIGSNTYLYWNADYENYGPAGSNEVMFFYVESNVNNTADAITGNTLESTNDYSTLLNIPIIDADQNFLDLFGITESILSDDYVFATKICSQGFVTEAVQVYNLEYIPGYFSYCPELADGLDASTEVYEYPTACQHNISCTVTNSGTEIITSFDYTVTVDGISENYTWTGQLLTMNVLEIDLVQIDDYTDHSIEFSINLADEQLDNNSDAFATTAPAAFTSHVRLHITPQVDHFYSYSILDENGLVNVHSLDVTANQESIIETYLPHPGCYEFQTSFALMGDLISMGSVHEDGTETILTGPWLDDFLELGLSRFLGNRDGAISSYRICIPGY
jgi:hypothetical protein